MSREWKPVFNQLWTSNSKTFLILQLLSLFLFESPPGAKTQTRTLMVRSEIHSTNQNERMIKYKKWKQSREKNVKERNDLVSRSVFVCVACERERVKVFFCFYKWTFAQCHKLILKQLLPPLLQVDGSRRICQTVLVKQFSSFPLFVSFVCRSASVLVALFHCANLLIFVFSK